jgi:hypothetical protein
MPETAVYQFSWWTRLSEEIFSSRFATLAAIPRPGVSGTTRAVHVHTLKIAEEARLIFT